MKARIVSGMALDSLALKVYEALYIAILEQRLLPGAKLREAEIADIFKVSRTVVRQVLQQLGQEKLISLAHNRGATVASPGREEAAGIFEARQVIEGFVARKLCGRLEHEAIASLRALIARETDAFKAGHLADAIRLSGEFHMRLATLTGNSEFAGMLQYLIPRTSLLIAAHLPPGQPMCLSHDHMRLLHALEEGSEEAANREMQAHLLEIETRLSATAPVPGSSSLRDMLRMNAVN
jgi:DNA-binding GntR family transcriptional regulator